MANDISRITMNTVSNVATASTASKSTANTDNKAASAGESKSAPAGSSGAQQKIAALQNQIKQLTKKLQELGTDAANAQSEDERKLIKQQQQMI
nr:FlxA-like family protein [Pectobacterium brasiliense]